MFQIGADNRKELLGGGSVERARGFLVVDKVSANVIFGDLSHQSRHRTSDTCTQVHDLRAPGFLLERALYRFNLTANTADTRQHVLLAIAGM